MIITVTGSVLTTPLLDADCVTTEVITCVVGAKEDPETMDVMMLVVLGSTVIVESCAISEETTAEMEEEIADARDEDAATWELASDEELAVTTTVLVVVLIAYSKAITVTPKRSVMMKSNGELTDGSVGHSRENWWSRRLLRSTRCEWPKAIGDLPAAWNVLSVALVTVLILCSFYHNTICRRK